MTELIWDGKYDKDGKKVAPVRIALPFQTIETVNESAQERQHNLDLFSQGRQTDWRNRLIWGDKKYVLPSLLPEFAGKVNLVYIDPPFDTGADFSFTATIPDNPDTPEDESVSFIKKPSIIEQKAYRDTWGKGLDSYLQWFYETALMLRELLAENGSVYVHCDWKTSGYLNVLMDEIFGKELFRNDVIWHYPGREMHITTKFNCKHDTIYFYAKSSQNSIKMDQIALPYDKETRLKGLRRKVYRDQDGREWVWETRGQASGQEPYKRYVDEIISQGKALNDVWGDLQFLRGNHPERVAYPTQKPESLLERVIKASSNDGDLVLDCFCGSGTTPAVAEKLNRRWIACDLGRFAIHVTRKRLLGIENVKPFVVQNLGKYERQAWQSAEFEAPEDAMEREIRYRRFILDLYRAEPVSGHTWLHGVKSGRMVHIGAVDAPVTKADVSAICRELWKAVGKGKGSPETARVDVLGWDFAFEINEGAKETAAQANVEVKFKKIPREVLEKKAVEQGDVFFYELAALSVETKVKGRAVSLKLKDFVIPVDDIPEDVRGAITHWSQLVDYWAVDWDYKEDTFHNQWQSYRTRKENDIELSVQREYKEKGKYEIVVKVIDILGNDTTKLINVEVK